MNYLKWGRSSFVVILGIDPGIAIVGWGVIEYDRGSFRPRGYGAIRTDSGLSVEDRLCIIDRQLGEIIDKYNPVCMSVEELFWNTNQKTGIVVAEARGVILCCAKRKGLSIREYTPLQVKQAVTGYGRADKKQMEMMVTTLLKLAETPKPDDTADALAIAICHAHSGASGLGAYYNKTVTAGKGVTRKITDPRILGGTNIVIPAKKKPTSK